MDNKTINMIILLFFVSLTFCSAKDLSKVYDIKGNIKTLQEISENKTLVIIFFSTYTCISCNEEINTVLDSLSEKYNLKVIIIGRLRGEFDLLEAYELKNIVKKYFPNYQLYLDIHHSNDVWPPKNLQGGFFQSYKVERFPAILFYNKGLNEFVSYDMLFPTENHNNLLNDIEAKIIKIMNKSKESPRFHGNDREKCRGSKY